MKLAFIIIPHDHKGESGIDVISKTVNQFRLDYGGCTHYQVDGIWKDNAYDNPIKCQKIEVALNDNDTFHFLDWAMYALSLTNVEELMVQTPCGNIEFIRWDSGTYLKATYPYKGAN